MQLYWFPIDLCWALFGFLKVFWRLFWDFFRLAISMDFFGRFFRKIFLWDFLDALHNSASFRVGISCWSCLCKFKMLSTINVAFTVESFYYFLHELSTILCSLVFCCSCIDFTLLLYRIWFGDELYFFVNSLLWTSLLYMY